MDLKSTSDRLGPAWTTRKHMARIFRLTDGNWHPTKISRAIRSSRISLARTCDIDALSEPALQSSIRFWNTRSLLVRRPLWLSSTPSLKTATPHVIPEVTDDNRIPLLDADTPKTTRPHTSTVTPCNLPRRGIPSSGYCSCASRANSSTTYRCTTSPSSLASTRCVSPSSAPRKHNNNPQPESRSHKSDQRRYTANCLAS